MTACGLRFDDGASLVATTGYNARKSALKVLIQISKPCKQAWHMASRRGGMAYDVKACSAAAAGAA